MPAGSRPRPTLVIAAVLALALALAPLGPARAAVPAEVGFDQAGALRVDGILRLILIANSALCGDRQSDHGLVLGAPALFPGGAPVIAVLPGSPAEAAGLQPGDLLRGINGTPWSPDPTEAAAFARALGETARSARLALVIERDHRRFDLMLTGQPACRAAAELRPTRAISAAAAGTTVIVASGLERLLTDDAELAFAVAHETAHIVLGHTAPDRRGAIGDPAQRPAMERAADALALRLMAGAGYDPAAAASAWPKIADASRPPLHRLLDLHGPYMATDERTAFLASGAAALRASAPRRPAGRSR